MPHGELAQSVLKKKGKMYVRLIDIKAAKFFLLSVPDCVSKQNFLVVFFPSLIRNAAAASTAAGPPLVYEITRGGGG